MLLTQTNPVLVALQYHLERAQEHVKTAIDSPRQTAAEVLSAIDDTRLATSLLTDAANILPTTDASAGYRAITSVLNGDVLLNLTTAADLLKSGASVSRELNRANHSLWRLQAMLTGE